MLFMSLSHGYASPGSTCGREGTVPHVLLDTTVSRAPCGPLLEMLWEQDSNLCGWRKGRFITLAGQHPGSLQKWHRPHSSRLWGFYASECRSKQAGRTKANVAISLLLGGYNLSYQHKVTTYHTTSRLQHTTLAHL
jgi:hypothetical protein